MAAAATAARRALTTTKLTPIPPHEFARKVTRLLLDSGPESLASAPSLLSNLQPDSTHLIISNPNLPTKSAVHFFDFLNQNTTSWKLDIRADFALICRLACVRRYEEAKERVRDVVEEEKRLGCLEVRRVGEVLGERWSGSVVAHKVFDSMLRVYGERKMFKRALEVFEYMVENE